MPLVFTLAFRNLFHDRLRFVATVIGIVFSIVLVTVQMGLYLGFGQMVTTMIDHASADLWIMPKGTKCFEDPSLLDTRQRSRALAVPGVAEAIPVVIGFADWRTPSGSSTPVFVVGSDLRSGGLAALESGGRPHRVAVHAERGRRRSHLFRPARHFRAGRARRNPPAERAGGGGHRTASARSPRRPMCSWMSTGRAPTPACRRARPPISWCVSSQAPTSSRSAAISLASLTDVEVLTPAEFRERSRSFWLFGTGAGAALFAGALLGVIVGTVIVAQTLYSSTKDHLNEFATLRAIGSSRSYIYKVIICQALLSAVIGFGLADLVGFVVVRMTAASALPIVITPELDAWRCSC